MLPLKSMEDTRSSLLVLVSFNTIASVAAVSLFFHQAWRIPCCTTSPARSSASRSARRILAPAPRRRPARGPRSCHGHLCRKTKSSLSNSAKPAGASVAPRISKINPNEVSRALSGVKARQYLSTASLGLTAGHSFFEIIAAIDLDVYVDASRRAL